MDVRSLFEAFARALGLYFAISSVVTLVAYLVNADNLAAEQLVAPIVSLILGIVLIFRGDAVTRWAFRDRT